MGENALRKFMVLLLTVLLSVSVVAAKEIVLWHWYDGALGQIFRDMIKSDFTAKTGINVNVLSVPIQDINNKLIMAHIGGEAPDLVELYTNQVVELGVRGALYNLNERKDIDIALKEIYPQFLPQLSYGKALFALPGEFNWLWTYYRSDIFKEYGLEVPKTWTEVKTLSSKLLARKKFMYYDVVGATSTLTTTKLLPFLFQNGSDLYNDKGDASRLDAPESIKAFKEFCSLYTEAKMLMEDPLNTTFSSGDTPLLFSQSFRYSMFERIAPQIMNQWSVVELPGTMREGKLDQTNTGNGLAWAMTASSKNKEEAWLLLKWLTSTETTSKFMILANQSSDKWRLFFASKGTLDNAIFPKEHLAIAQKALANCKVQRAVVGGYLADRYVDFAFNKVILQKEDPETAIKQAAKESTQEIQKKLKEFARFINGL